MRRNLRQEAPGVNVSLPPGQWQTYDIEFRAPEFDAAGHQTKGAVISVAHNGVKIHDAVVVDERYRRRPGASRPRRDRFASRTMVVIPRGSATSGSWKRSEGPGVGPGFNVSPGPP